MGAQQHDVVVIGAGPAGEVAAGRLAHKGLDVAIIERRLVAGECSFYACMPSKALLRPGHALAEAQRVDGAAQATGANVNVAAALARRDAIIHELDDAAQLPWLDELGITLYRGTGTLTGPRAVRVTAADGTVTTLAATTAVILATGSSPTIPPIAGLADARPWTNREATTATDLPRRAALLGGGPVGCELADAYARLGVDVTLISQDDRLLPREEPFAGAQVLATLRELGVDVRLGAEVVSVARPEAGGPVTLTLTTDLACDELIVATGRTPNSAGLGLEHVAVSCDDRGFVPTDRTLRVAPHDWLYAIGDVNGRALLTHHGKHQGHVAAQAILGVPGTTLHDGPPPVRCTFTEPEVAAVGHTASTARDAGYDVRVVDVPTGAVAGSSFVGHGTAGTCRVVIDQQRGVIIGATFTGANMGEQLHAATIAIVAAVPITQLWDAVPAFPSRTEVWLRLLEAIDGW